MNHPSRLTYVFAVLLAASAGLVQAQPQQQQQSSDKSNRISGIVLGIESRTRFFVVDRSGNEVAVQITMPVTYVINNESVNFEDVVKPGNIVRCMLDDQGRVNQILFRGQATQLETSQLRPFMGLNDAEWKVINDRITRIRDLQRISEGKSVPNRNDGSNGGTNGGPPPENPIRTILKSLQQSFWDPHQSSTEIESNLRQLRQLKAKAREDLAKARQELTELVTPRQEILLVLQGILD